SLKNKNVLTSKTGYYHTKTKNIYFRHEVVLKHPDYTLYADTLGYHIPTETAHFMGPSTILTKNHEIYTESGWYNTKKQLSMLTKNASVATSSRMVKADTLEYDNKNERGWAAGHISFTDTTENIELRGDKATYDEANRKIEITKNPLMLRFFEKDTLFMGADSILSHQPDSGKALVRAFHNVKFFKTDLEGICDSMVYNEPDSSLRFFNDPVMWYGNSQLTADHIHMVIRGRKISRAYLQLNAFIISAADTIGHNQVKGRNMTAYFNENKISKVRVYGNGQAVYYMGEEGKPYMGMNRTDCSDIELRMNDGKISGIVFITEPDATIFPINGINPKDKELKNFNWRAKDKPGRFYLPEKDAELEGKLEK
ncbi:MAG: OstA-like protein, partial [Flavobacteriales bacterium]